MKLNLGCSDRALEGFIGVDIAPPADQIVDLEGPWPWAESSVTEVRAHDVAEHIGDCDHVSDRWVCDNCFSARCDGPHGNLMHRTEIMRRHPLGRIHFMNQLHSVLTPGGIATIEVPDALNGAGFAQDPTHKTMWTRNSFQYFGAGPGGEFARNRLGDAYGITARFNLLSMDYREYQDTYDKVWKITVVLEAVK